MVYLPHSDMSICFLLTGSSNIDYIKIYSGTVSTSNLIYNTNYSIDSDPTTGNPRIKNLGLSNIQGD